MPVAIAQVDAAGAVTVAKNQIYYLTDTELIAIVGNLKDSADDTGLTSQYDLRYRRRTGSDGTGRSIS